MNLLRRVSSIVVFTAAVANLSGCGSSTKTIGSRTAPELPSTEKVLTEPDSPVDLSKNVVTLAPPTEMQPAVSALEIANVPSKVFSRDEASGALNLSFADLDLTAILGIEAVTQDDVKQFPDWLNSLNGKKIRIRGYMFPPFEETGIDRFILEGSTRVFNFGPELKAYELLEVRLASGTTTNYTGNARSMEVIGTFRIDPTYEDRRIQTLYLLEDAVVVAAKGVSRSPRVHSRPFFSFDQIRSIRAVPYSPLPLGSFRAETEVSAVSRLCSQTQRSVVRTLVPQGSSRWSDDGYFFR